jgi:hypothetical protein
VERKRSAAPVGFHYRKQAVMIQIGGETLKSASFDLKASIKSDLTIRQQGRNVRFIIYGIFDLSIPSELPGSIPGIVTMQ